MERKDRKLQEAIKTLSNLLENETPNGRIIRLIERGEVSNSEVYKELERYGYEWKTNKWLLSRSQWLMDTINQFENDLKGEGYHDLLIWMPPSYHDEPLDVFYDYLLNMELFIESEIKKRSSEWEVAKEKPTDSKKLPTAYEQHLLDQLEAQEHDIWERDLKHAENFIYVLRNSFFVNLCAHLEANLRSQCSSEVNSPIIKSAVNQLIGSLVNKIPEWQEILCYVDIRNCIVHEEGVLKKSRGEKIRKYCATKANITIQNDVVILEKGFCEDALTIVERFLRKVKIVRIDLK